MQTTTKTETHIFSVGTIDISFISACCLTFIYEIELKSVNSDLGFHAEDQNTEIQYVENTQFLFQSRANKIPWKIIIEYRGREWSPECSDDLSKARKVQSVEHSDLKRNLDEPVSFLFHRSISIKLVKHIDIKLISRINICVLQEWMFDFCIFSPNHFILDWEGKGETTKEWEDST